MIWKYGRVIQPQKYGRETIKMAWGRVFDTFMLEYEENIYKDKTKYQHLTIVCVCVCV